MALNEPYFYKYNFETKTWVYNSKLSMFGTTNEMSSAFTTLINFFAKSKYPHELNKKNC
jgi:hypothetical protein